MVLAKKSLFLVALRDVRLNKQKSFRLTQTGAFMCVYARKYISTCFCMYTYIMLSFFYGFIFLLNIYFVLHIADLFELLCNGNGTEENFLFFLIS